VPAGRRIFDVTPAETIELARRPGLSRTQHWHNTDAVLLIRPKRHDHSRHGRP
jgi:hypothetical protein